MKKYMSPWGLFTVFIVTVLVVFVVTQRASTPSVAETIRRALVGNLSDDDLLVLEECVETCKKQEADLAKDVLDLMSGLKNQTGMEEMRPLFEKVVLKSIDFYESEGNEFAVVEAYSSGFMLVSTEMQLNQESHSDSFVRRIAEGIEEMPERYPKVEEAHLLYGTYLAISGQGTDREQVKAYFDCLQMHPDSQSCLKAYEAEVESYESPRCIGKNLKSSFGFYAASDTKDARYNEVMKFDGARLFVDRGSQISNQSVIEVKVLKDAGGLEELNFEFTPEGQSKFGELTESVSRLKNKSKSTQSLAVVVGNEVISAPIVQERINSKSARISAGASEAGSKNYLSIVCDEITSPQLPEDLRI